MAIIRAKYKLDRRVLENILGRTKSRVTVRPYPPGQHGRGGKRRRKVSEYGLKILEQRKIRLFYGGMRLKELKRIIKECIRKKGRSDEQIASTLESRLSSVVYRMKLGITPFAAKQMINHGKIFINGKKVDIHSCRVKAGDKISLCDSMKDNEHVIAAIETTERQIPEYILMENKFTGTFVKSPTMSSIHYPCSINFNLLIEYFSM